jgi:hypothetical protein
MIFLGITLWFDKLTNTGRYVTGLAVRSVLSDWLRIRFATRSTALMQQYTHYKRKIS